jgi:fidgetin-like protein 1
MPKQLYIPLPCSAAREQLVQRQVGAGRAVRADLSAADLAKLVAKTEGYSGSDMKNLIQEACQGPVREAIMQHGASGALASAL